MKSSKKGIALLVTVLFIMAITVAIGIGLKQVKVASLNVENESFMFQTSTILEDVLLILDASKELEQIAHNKSNTDFFTFLSNVSYLSLESSGLRVNIHINSARSNFNVNALINTDESTINIDRVNALKEYLSHYRINVNYVDILLDVMSGIKEDMRYYSAIFNENPYLFRDYIVSEKHLGEVNDFYMKTYHHNLKNIDFTKFFYFNFNKDKNIFIDLNYATAEVWEMMLGCDKQKSHELASGGGRYTSLKDLSLSEKEKVALAKFQTSYFEPFLDVVIIMTQRTQYAKIRFEYNIQTKKGSNFVYEI